MDLMGINRMFDVNPTAGFRAANQKHLQGAQVTCRWISSDVRKLEAFVSGDTATFRIVPRFLLLKG
jgi:hypothetical protein